MKTGKFIVLFDTETGEILGTRCNPPSESVLSQGMCQIIENIVSGLDLAGHSQSEVSALLIDRRYLIAKWSDDTTAEIRTKVRAQGLQPYSLVKKNGPIQFTAQQKADIVAEYKTITGNTNIDALLVTSGPAPSASELCVDLATRKLELKKPDVTYD